jgi:uncharacterized RmlC-like cupin family protein
MSSPGVRKAGPEELTAGQATPGMTRKEAFATGQLWAGLLLTEPGTLSGWHHHGRHESTIYVLTGALRMEFGVGGRDVLEAGPGEFIYVAPGAVHRESNPTQEVATAVVVRAGTGQVVVNVDGPEPA